jgi:excisionase family DNA binding protein
MHKVVQVAQMLQLSRTKVYEMVAAGILPSVKFGDRSVRIPADGLRHWIAANMRDAEAQ